MSPHRDGDDERNYPQFVFAVSDGHVHAERRSTGVYQEYRKLGRLTLKAGFGKYFPQLQ